MRSICYLLLCFTFLSTPAYTEVQFVDITTAAGIDFEHYDGRSGEKYLIETLGSGALFFDFNVDGHLDLYIVNAAHTPSPTQPVESANKNTHPPTNKLYQNNGDGTFTDITEKAGVGGTGYGVGCAAADINNDGFPEIYVTNFGSNRLYRNNGDGTFTDITEKAGVGDKRWGTGCAFLDYNLDGNVDLYVVNYMIFSAEGNQGWLSRGARIYCSPVDQMDNSRFKSEPDILYRNNGDGTFTDVTDAAGISHRALGLAVAVGDYDNDGDPDLHIANDMEPDLLYQNSGDGTFIDITDLTGTGYDENGMPGSGMGSAFGDYDNDGDLDLVVSNAPSQPVLLFHNEETLFFTDTSFSLGIGAVTVPYFKWAVEFFDYNNDGLQDIFVSNGHLQDNIELFSDATYPQTDLLLQNIHRDGRHTFSDVSAEVRLTQLTKMVGRGAAFGDYDNDGDIDIFLNHSNQPAKLLRNDGGNSNNWITIHTIGTQSNVSGIGTKITLKAGILSLFKEVHSGSSYLSQNDLRVHFGLGKNTKIDSLELRWPSGHTDNFSDLKANQVLQIKEGQGVVNGQKD
ncbi:MAG: CRTAC1 family protein [Candidatus Poribacteria bacterium]|nr:CRTAC1 family protein [Candidatus Poribacteria bacterium]